jgi:anti-sigma factor RsiW
MQHNTGFCAFDKQKIEAYYDNSLTDPAEIKAIETHLETCRDCKTYLGRLSAVCRKTQAVFNELAETADFTGREAALFSALHREPARRARPGKRQQQRFRPSFAARFLIPTAALVAVLVFFFSPPRPQSPGPREASAIVSAVSGNFENAVILETPSNRQTVIWFTESEGGPA